MHIYCLLLLILCPVTLGKHITVTYHFAEHNQKDAETIQIYTNKLSNDNKYWTTSYEKEYCAPCRESVSVSSDKVTVVEELAGKDLEGTIVKVFREFSEKWFSTKALENYDFDNSLFNTHSAIFEELDIHGTKEFDRKLGEKAEYVFVLFYKKESFSNYEALLHFSDALRRTKQVGGIVNCDKYDVVCESNNIQDSDYPTLHAFKNEEFYKKFDLDFQQDQLHDWMLIIAQPDITQLSESAVPYYRSGIIPGFDSTRETVTMFFTTSKTTATYQNFAKFAKQHHGKYHLTAMVSKEVEKWAIHPAFITMKPHDPYVKAFTLHTKLDYTTMVQYLEDGAHPSCHHFTNTRDLIYSLSGGRPVLIYHDPFKTSNSSNFLQVASKSQMEARKLYYGIIEGLDIFGLYLMNVFEIHQPSYVMLRKTDLGYCINSMVISDESSWEKWAEKIVGYPCSLEIGGYRLPVERLAYFERIEDVSDLQEEWSHKNVHEEL